jgi:hypothetical protein
MKKNKLIIAAVAAVILVGGIALSMNPEMLQGRFSSITRNPSVQSGSSVTSTIPSPSSSVDYFALGTEVTALTQDFDDEVTLADNRLSGYHDIIEASLTSSHVWSSDSDYDSLDNRYNRVLSFAEDRNEEFDRIESAASAIKTSASGSTGALALSAKNNAETLLSDLSTARELYNDYDSESAEHYEALYHDYGDLEATDLSIVLGGRSLTVSIDIANNTLDSDEVRIMTVEDLVASLELRGGERGEIYVSDQFDKSSELIESGQTNTVNVEFTGSELQTWLDEYAAGNTDLSVTATIIVDADEDRPEHNEKNNQIEKAFSDF